MLNKGTVLVATALFLCLGQNVFAQDNQDNQDKWKLGIGTGLSSISLDGDIGFPTSAGGVIADIDLDNNDTSDLVKSGFGFGGFAKKGKWTILYSLGTATLEGSDANLLAEWEKTQIMGAGVYNFANAGRHFFGALFGIRYAKHEWDITTTENIVIDEAWTDALVGVTHTFAFAKRWTWSNSLDWGFGDSEGSYLFVSVVDWQVAKHWRLGFNIKQHSIDFEEGVPGNSDFYLYDVDEASGGIGFLYIW